jgi:hypothetical protein
MIDIAREWIETTFMVPPNADPFLFFINTMLLIPGVVSFSLIFLLYIFLLIYFFIFLIYVVAKKVKIHIMDKMR